jgi:hypothetical protein
MTNLYNENTLVQQTTADYLEQELGLDSVYLQQRGFRAGQPAGIRFRASG